VTLRGCSPDMERMKSRYMARHEARQQTYAGVLAQQQYNCSVSQATQRKTVRVN
jgi:hypothetical protein